MKRLGATFLVLVMVCTSILVGLTGNMAAEEKARADSRLLTTPDGLSWADPVKITQNNVDDTYPTLVVDSNANSHILYYQNGQDYKYQKWQRPGKLVVKETHIVTAAMTFQHAGQGTAVAEPTERIGIDGDENIHIVWETGAWGSNQYQKFSNGGKPISGVIDPSPSAQMPQLPYLGVGKNNNAYVATEQEGGGENGQLTKIDKNFNTQMVDVKTSTEGVGLVVDTWNDDVIHYFSRTWSGTGIFHTKLTPDLQKVVEPHEIFPGVITGSGWESPVPMATTTPNGHVHVLLYTQTANPKTYFYGETDKSGNPLNGGNTYQVTADACDYGDIVGDGENNVYVIWGACADGHVYYTKILEGNEQSSLTRQPIKISAGLTGQSSWPQFGVDPDNGLHVVFLNNGDGDNEVYYRYAYTFGVELGMEPTEQAKMMFIHPQETKVGNLTIKNVGGQNDTMFLNVTMDLMGHEDQGWDASLSDSELELQPSEIQKIELTVRGPDFGNPNDFIQVCVNATSMRNPDKNDTVCIRVFLVVNRNVQIDCPDNVHVAMAGQKNEFTCYVKNSGDISEDIKVEIVDEPSEWEVTLSDDMFPGMKSQEFKTIKLSVTPPKEALANEVGSITLKAYIQTMNSIRDMAAVHVIVQPNIFIKMQVDQPQRYVDPGNSTEFKLTIFNQGNLAGTVVIILEIVSGTGDWDVVLDRTSVAVPNNGQQEVKMTVLAPENARAGTRLVVRVVASDEARTMSSDVTTTTVVNQVHKLEVSTQPPEVVVKPGETANYEVTIKNNGNGDEQLSLKPEMLKNNWVQALLQEGVPIDEILLHPGEQKSYALTIKVPGSELAGSYVSSFNLHNDQTKWDFNFDLTTRVQQIYSIDVTTTLSKQTGTPGKAVSFTVIVKNNGNGDDNIALTLEDKPVNWESRFIMDERDVETLPLTPGAQAKVTLLLSIPFAYDTDNTEYSMSVTGTSEGRVQDKVTFVVDLLLPNIKIMKVKYSSSHLVNNKPVSIEVIISNEGLVACENVTVRFYDHGIAGEQTLERLPGGQNKTAVFQWMPKAGSHKLEFLVDPDNKIIESNEEDNKLVDRVTVGNNGGIMPGFDGIIVLMALVPVALILLRKRK
jgi:uncharacterized membrane protein